MAKADLTAQRLRELLEYDSESGIFNWKTRVSNRVYVGMQAGSVNPKWGRLQIRVCGFIYYAHRLAWLYVHGAWPTQQIDHIDGNPLNNRIANLRDVAPATNQQNRQALSKRGRSGLTGAFWNCQTKKWRARIYVNGKSFSLGCHDTALDAHAAYVEAKRKLHAGCTI